MDNTITWVHLSDFHFCAADEYDAGIVLDALLQDLADRISQDGLQPGFAVVSGDLAFSGKPAEYAQAARFLDRLLATLGLDRDRLLLVPGNHDADRDAVSPVAQVVHRSLAAHTQVDSFRRAIAETLQDEVGRLMFGKRLEAYRGLVSDYLGDHLPLDDVYGLAVKRLVLAGKQVALLGFNSAWLSYGGEEDRGRLAVGERQVRSALKASEDADLCIGVLHHPLEWLHDLDRHDVEPLLLQHCGFLLHGHLHQTATTSLSNPDASAIVLAAGACYGARSFPNSYHWVQLDMAAGEGRVVLRRYSDQAGGFWTRDAMTYRNAPDGVWTFPLPPSLVKTSLQPPAKVIDRPARPGDVRVRQAYAIYTTLGHLPAFLDAPQSLRPPFRLLGQGDPAYLEAQGTQQQKEELRHRFRPPQQAAPGQKVQELGCFVPGMGRIVAGLDSEWALTRADAPASHLGHVPWLIQPNWRVALDPTALGVVGWPANLPVRVEANLALHLYAYGLVAVCLRLALRSGPGLDWAALVGLLKAASPFQAPFRQPKAFTLRMGRQVLGLRAGELAEQAVRHLAQQLFETPVEYQIQGYKGARLDTMVHVQETVPETLDPEIHYSLMAGLMLMSPRWEQIADADARTYRRLDSDLGHREGDWVKMNVWRLGLFTPDAHRKSRRKYLWRLHTWAELARAQAYLAQLSVPRLARLAADPGLEVPPSWRAFWQDLPHLGNLAFLEGWYHSAAFPMFSEAVSLEPALELFKDYHDQFLAVERRPSRAGPPGGEEEAVDLAALGELLRAAFTAADLRQFCQDRPLFRPVLDYISVRASLNEIVETVIEYSQKRDLLEELLEGIRDANPRQYNRFRDSLAPGASHGS
jgi:predicted MPP superfamily phosphohydrolase